MEFRKTNEAIGLRVKEGSLGLLARKAFNVMVYHAQTMKEPGKNAPIDTPEARKYFWMPLADLARDAAYDSKDAQYLRQQLESLQDIKLEMEKESQYRQWTSERLVSSVTMVQPGPNKRGTSVWVGYAFPPATEQLVLAPGSNYTRLSIVYQSSLKSGASLALYEICRRYATNPSRKTGAHPVAYWFFALTGKAVDSERVPEFRYFRRDTLNPAISEINQITDIDIELILIKKGRKVTDLQFEVHEKQQAKLDFPAPPVVDTELLKQLQDFGLAPKAAEDLAATVGDDVLRLAIAKTRARMENHKLTPVEEPAAYLRWQISELMRNPVSVEQLAAPSQSAKKADDGGGEILDRFHTERGIAALELYQQQDATERDRVWSAFKAEPSNRSVKLEKGLDSKMVRQLFSRWYAYRIWGEPTAADIARFVEHLAKPKV